MRLCRKLSLQRALGALVLLVVTTTPADSQEPVYVRGLMLPVVDDAIGYPRAVTADPHTEEVFVCDTRKNRILIYDGNGIFRFQIPGGDVFSAPHDIAIDPEGYLVVVANHERRRTLIELDFDGLFLRELPLVGLPDDSLEPTITSVALSPAGDRIYAIDTANLSLWIADRDGNLQNSVDLAEGLTETEIENLILGHVDVYGETVLVAIRMPAEIRLFGFDGSFQGQAGIKGTAYCRLGRPVAAALTDTGELVIADQQRMFVLRWNPQTNRCLGEYIGLGDLAGFLYFPMDLALDSQGQIFVSQGFLGRVQMYEGMARAATLPSSP